MSGIPEQPEGQQKSQVTQTFWVVSDDNNIHTKIDFSEQLNLATIICDLILNKRGHIDLQKPDFL